jgi:hypothetical protein
MKALSIRQPWAHLIVHAGKDIENRDWFTRLRGRILVHAAKGMTRDEYADVREFCDRSGNAIVPDFDALQRGGVIGSVEIVDCVEHSESRWFFGRYGFVLRDPRPLPFIPYKGSLGFFEVPDHLIGGVA